MLLEHLVERLHHVFHAGQVLGTHALHRARHLVDRLLQQLLFELLHQLLEALLGLLRFEVVRIEFTDLARKVVRHQVESHVAFQRGVLGILGPALIARILCIAQGIVDRVALLVDHIVEFVVDLVVDPAKVMLIESILTFLAELFEQLTQPL